jgi:hypothetical protein
LPEERAYIEQSRSAKSFAPKSISRSRTYHEVPGVQLDDRRDDVKEVGGRERDDDVPESSVPPEFVEILPSLDVVGNIEPDSPPGTVQGHAKE